MAEIPVNAVVVKNDKKYIKQSLDKPNNSNTTGTRVGDIEKKIGDMSMLKTVAKDTIVDAINEAKESGGSSVEIVDDLVTDDSDKALSAKQGKLLNDSKFDKSDAETLASKLGEKVDREEYGAGITDAISLAIGNAQDYTDEKIKETSQKIEEAKLSMYDYADFAAKPKVMTETEPILARNTEYYLGETENLTISLPNGEIGEYCFVKFKSGAAPTQITVEGDNIVGDIPMPIANKTYEIIANWNGEKWVCAYRGY